MVKKAGNRKEGKTMPGKVRVQDAESEVEDERFAAAASMPVGQNEVEDDEVEESSDDGESQSANEEGDGGLAKFMRHDKGHDKLWADPTHAEMKGLKEAELHFKSSLLRLQMDELKAQVSVNYAKTSALESWLHRLKGILEALPAAKLSTSSLGEETLLDKFEFRAPGAVHMVGSYLLRTVTRPDLTIDLLVEMPAEILHHKDFLNRKYLHKRQLYLGHIATQLRSHASVDAVHFSAFRSDNSKPCVLLKPAGLSGLSSKFSVRILAAPPPETFPLARFRPSRNNVRLPGVTDIAEQPPTPTYNTAIAEDLRMVHHLQLMHAEFCNCVALAETAMLLKVWLRQRYFNSAPDSLNGFTVSILLLYLLQHRKIARSMSCYHMLRATFVFLSNKDTLEQGIHLTPIYNIS
jgi:U3 small nucleolar RNA-associated protein 22